MAVPTPDTTDRYGVLVDDTGRRAKVARVVAEVAVGVCGLYVVLVVLSLTTTAVLPSLHLARLGKAPALSPSSTVLTRVPELAVPSTAVRTSRTYSPAETPTTERRSTTAAATTTAPTTTPTSTATSTSTSTSTSTVTSTSTATSTSTSVVSSTVAVTTTTRPKPPTTRPTPSTHPGKKP